MHQPSDQPTVITKPAASARLSQMPCFAIYSAAHAFTRVYKPLLDPLGLTYPQYLVLLVLWEQENITVKEIGERLFLDSGTLTPLFKRLQMAGLVERTRDAKDERQVRITLTDKGRAIEGQVSAITAQLVCVIGQSEEKLHVLTQEIGQLRGALQGSVEA